ncbi:interleukin-20-like [Terrapene carolina triunguis]|uniref:interleukin-20-like n=1 Tax=Terrapene triunguis TaxID=2587831 RepID=UPI0011561FA9|nr:interleukin-20-like [Terrapene carolina triunguis]
MISMNVNEIRASFTAIKETIQSKDERTDIRILHKSYSLQDTEPMDRCCFLCHLLRFYLATVFSHCKASSPRASRKVSSIANSFLSIRKDLRLCHEVSMCHCGEDVKHKCGQIQSQYEKMDVASAGLKALGELDILLDWMDKADKMEI